jgi:hypothetical protein
MAVTDDQKNRVLWQERVRLCATASLLCTPATGGFFWWPGTAAAMTSKRKVDEVRGKVKEEDENECRNKAIRTSDAVAVDLRAIGLARHAARLAFAQKQQEAEAAKAEQSRVAEREAAEAVERARIQRVNEALAPLHQVTRDIQASTATVQSAASVAALVLHLQNVAYSLDANYSHAVQATMPSPDDEPLAREACDQLATAANALLLALDSNRSYVVRIDAPEMAQLSQLVLRIGKATGVAVELGQVRMHTDEDARLAREDQAEQDAALAQSIAQADQAKVAVTEEWEEQEDANVVDNRPLPNRCLYVSLTRVAESLVHLGEIHAILQPLDAWNKYALARFSDALRAWQQTTRCFWTDFCRAATDAAALTAHQLFGRAARELSLAHRTKEQLAKTMELVYTQMDRQEGLSENPLVHRCIEVLEPMHQQLAC